MLNRYHLHALPQIDYPLALQTYFGEEGLAQTGLSASLAPPPPVGFGQRADPPAHGRRERGLRRRELPAPGGARPSQEFLGCERTPTYAELGLSGIDGSTGGNKGSGGQSRVWGADFTLHWQPPTRAKYREVTWRTELLRSERDDEEGTRHDAGAATPTWRACSLRTFMAACGMTGWRIPSTPITCAGACSPTLPGWQSEFVRLRGEFGFLKDGSTGGEEKRFTLQLTWAAGPHKHETY